MYGSVICKHERFSSPQRSQGGAFHREPPDGGIPDVCPVVRADAVEDNEMASPEEEECREGYVPEMWECESPCADAEHVAFGDIFHAAHRRSRGCESQFTLERIHCCRDPVCRKDHCECGGAAALVLHLEEDPVGSIEAGMP